MPLIMGPTYMSYNHVRLVIGLNSASELACVYMSLPLSQHQSNIAIMVQYQFQLTANCHSHT